MCHSAQHTQILRFAKASDFEWGANIHFILQVDEIIYT